jgi:2-phospho-L-lactate/phosphoenolpyruvate guanylyltransferase
MGFTAIIPVKPWQLAKSRLSLDPNVRAELARALTADTLATVERAAKVDGVVVVSSEPEALAMARAAGVGAIADPPEPGDPLNDAIRSGVAWAQAARPDDPVVVIPADLCSLTPDALDGALVLARAHRLAFVPDRHGIGTTLLAGATPAELVCAYGGASGRAHQRLGAERLEAVDPRVRLDVDTLEDLMEGQRLGLNRNAAAVALSEVFSSAMRS